METESNEQVESVTGENPFDGKVTDHAMAWAHVNAAYGISLSILLVYIVVISVRLAGFRRSQESSE